MSLKKKVFAASSWVLAGYAGSQVLRFGTNMVLTRLLYPEAFGLMVVVFAVNMGVSLLSDLGIGSGIVIHNAGADERYLNTAWTIQILRGLALGVLIFACAYPLALAFSNLALVPLLRIVALLPVVSGFTTTKVALADRQLAPKRRVAIDIGLQVVAAAITAALAWALRSPVALAWGTVVSTLLTVLVQHAVLHGPANRLHWDKSQASEIISIGQFSLLSSALMYATGEGSRLFSATMLDSRMLGLVGLAGALSVMPWQAVQQLSQRVLMPAYAEVVRSGDQARLRRAVLKARAMQILPCWIVNFATLLVAGTIFHVLYDKRYAQGADILRIQCVGMLLAVLSSSYNGLLWGMRKLKLNLVLQGAQSLTLWLGMYIGYRYGGPIGLVVGTALSNWVYYPISFLAYRRLGLTSGWFDLAVIVPSTLVAFLLWRGYIGAW